MTKSTVKSVTLISILTVGLFFILSGGVSFADVYWVDNNQTFGMEIQTSKPYGFGNSPITYAPTMSTPIYGQSYIPYRQQNYNRYSSNKPYYTIVDRTTKLWRYRNIFPYYSPNSYLMDTDQYLNSNGNYNSKRYSKNSYENYINYKRNCNGSSYAKQNCVRQKNGEQGKKKRQGDRKRQCDKKRQNGKNSGNRNCYQQQNGDQNLLNCYQNNANQFNYNNFCSYRGNFAPSPDSYQQYCYGAPKTAQDFEEYYRSLMQEKDS